MSSHFGKSMAPWENHDLNQNKSFFCFLFHVSHLLLHWQVARAATHEYLFFVGDTSYFEFWVHFEFLDGSCLAQYTPVILALVYLCLKVLIFFFFGLFNFFGPKKSERCIKIIWSSNIPGGWLGAYFLRMHMYPNLTLSFSHIWVPDVFYVHFCENILTLKIK